MPTPTKGRIDVKGSSKNYVSIFESGRGQKMLTWKEGGVYKMLTCILTSKLKKRKQKIFVKFAVKVYKTYFLCDLSIGEATSWCG